MSTLNAGAAGRLDLLLLALWAAEVLILWVRMRHLGAVDAPPLILVSAVVYVPMLWRRQRPLAVLCAVVLGGAAVSAVAPGFHPTLCIWLALFLAAQRSRKGALLALIIAVGATGLNVVDLAGHALDPEIRLGIVVCGTLFFLLADLAAYGLGRWVRWSVLQRERMARYAAVRAVAEERRRIARELHDVVAHAVSLMTLQAAGAARMVTTDPERACTALQDVADLGEQATVELRAMLGSLCPDQGRHEDRADTTWRLENIDRVVEKVRMTGRDVVVSLTGQVRPLEPVVDEAAYRIVQEALTNAVKHADPQRPVRLEIAWGRHEVTVAVRTAGKCPDWRDRGALSTRSGIRGMRQRVHAVGGSLVAEPMRDGGFQVVATMPLVGRPTLVEGCEQTCPAALVVHR